MPEKRTLRTWYYEIETGRRGACVGRDHNSMRGHLDRAFNDNKPLYRSLPILSDGDNAIAPARIPVDVVEALYQRWQGVRSRLRASEYLDLVDLAGKVEEML